MSELFFLRWIVYFSIVFVVSTLMEKNLMGVDDTFDAMTSKSVYRNTNEIGWALKDHSFFNCRCSFEFNQ